MMRECVSWELFYCEKNMGLGVHQCIIATKTIGVK